jgi:hypothetical protein
MKRILIFVLLGPLFAALLVTLPLFVFGGARTGVGAVLYLGYVYGLIPALLAGLADHFFAKWVTPLWRTVATGFAAVFIVGFALSYLSFGVSLYGLMGFFPAAVCSWLSSGKV